MARKMFGLNSYLSTDNARDYVDQLFGKRDAAPTSDTSTKWTPPSSYDPDAGISARDRAMNNIISIVWNLQHGDTEQKSAVNEQGGYILDATGTDEGDKIDMKAISAFNIDTGAGDDTVNLKAGSLAGLTAGEGNDQINLAASYMAEIDGGAGDDTIQMAGSLADGVYGGDGNDTLKISAKTILDANGGAGDDTLYLEGERIFAAGGTGNDTITINNKGDKPAELSFAKGDGSDTVNTNGPLDIRFGYADFFSSAGTSAAGFTPDDLDITVADNKLIVKSKTSDDAITINFDAKALEGKQPSFAFAMDQGDYVLKIR